MHSIYQVGTVVLLLKRKAYSKVPVQNICQVVHLQDVPIDDLLHHCMDEEALGLEADFLANHLGDFNWEEKMV